MSWSGVVGVGSVALMLGGLIGLVATSLRIRENWLIAGSEFAGSESYFLFLISLFSLGALAICVGVVGTYPIFRNTSSLVRRIAFWGIVLTVVSAGPFAAGWMLMITWGSDGTGVGTLFEFIRFTSYAIPLGLVILGIAALGVRSLGLFRWLPLFVGITLSLLADMLVSYLFRPDPVGMDVVYIEDMPVEREILFDIFAPLITDAVAYSGLLLFGIVLFGAEKREARIVAREQELTERKNLAVARTLYDRAWVRGEMDALDEYISEEVVDTYHGEVGLGNFRRNVARLRRTFPDIRFTVEEQRASGDTVTTGWRFEGTDEGGVLWSPPTGKRVSLSGSFTDRLEDGKVVEHGGESEMNELMRQMQDRV